ncbi:hypothetical protein HOG81_06985 [bacterium]|jgi:hypothetical protein|nr:hypothetical protein [bacterium]
MKNAFLSVILILSLFFFSGCGSLNKAEGQFHYNNTITKGQELLDLKKALDEGAIDQNEYDLMKDKIINDEYIKSFFKQMDEIDEEEFDSVSI